MKSLFIICIIAGVASLLYYVLCMIYTGTVASFSFIWIIFSGVVFGIGGVIYCVVHNKIIIPKGIQVGAIACILLFSGIFIAAEIAIFYYGKQSAPSGAQYIIILGAKVNKRAVSGSLKKRLDTAVDYVKKNPETRIIVTGGQGKDEEITEALAMEEYLLKKGIKKHQIQKEEKATNTLENILYSRMLMENSHGKVVLVTNRFHIYRSLCMARSQGMKHVYGLSAPTDPVMALTYYVREGFAVIKYKWTKQI